MPDVIETPLANMIRESGLAADRADRLMSALGPLVSEAGDLVRQAAMVEVTDATQVDEMKQARALRLKLKDVRLRAEAARKEIKADVLATGRVIDAAGKWLKSKIEPEESRLEECEKFAERAEAARRAKLKISREQLLQPFGVDCAFYDLGAMPEATFAQLFDSSRMAHEAKIAAAKKAEDDLRAAEEARKAEDARVRAENERLRQEAIAREAAAKAEREAAERVRLAEAEKARKEREAIEAKARAERLRIEAENEIERKRLALEAKAKQDAADAIARKEREAREAAEAELTAKKKAEAAKAAAEARARKAAELAPDKDKIRAIATAIRAVPLPNLSAQEAKVQLGYIKDWIDELAKQIDQRAEIL